MFDGKSVLLRATMCLLLQIMGGMSIAGTEKDPIAPRVPPDQMAVAKGYTSPFYDEARNAPANIIAEGKKLYEDPSKGTCFVCHGKSGKGDGPGGVVLAIRPRNFTNCQFHAARTDGELFWVIAHGINGMPKLVPGPISEEEAWKIIAYERTFCKQQGN